MRHLPVPRRLVLGLGAVAGVALAHVVDYVIVIPGRSRRAEVLAETGHVWHHAIALGAVAGLLALAGAIWSGLHQRALAGRRMIRPTPLGAEVRSVAVLQLGLFAGLETLERLLSHEPVGPLVTSRLFLLGLVLQAAVACAVVGVLRAAQRVAARLPGTSAPALASVSEGVGELHAILASRAPSDRPDCRGPPAGRLRVARS